MLTTKWVLLLLFAAAAPGCAGKSSFVPPRTLDVDPASYQETKLIRYRTLVRSDFKSAKAPQGMDERYIGAVTAALIRTSRVTFSTTRHAASGGPAIFVASVKDLIFEARMSQSHSWWNAAHIVTDGELLVHEQVHFAFSELAARRANAEIEHIKSRIRSFARTPEEAVRIAAARVQCEVDRVQDEVNELNMRFDRETSNGHHCELNQLWFELVQRELDQGRSVINISSSREPVSP
jgi:hypothetical protein